MKKETPRGRKLDRAKVATGQDYEVAYEKEKLHKSAEEIKKAAKDANNSRKKMEKNLKK